jgi:non-ribosomal peptide synthetase component F
MGGEPIQSSEVARWTQAETIIGIYGPAECAQALSFIHLGTQTPNNHVGFSFGARTWLVQPGCPDRLAAIGTIGELLIEGPTVSKGYCGDAGKAAASYIQAPQWLSRGSPMHPGRHGTLYKTGDVLRYNSDGSLQFIGRKDTMIKLRGQRIELAEVEYHVRASIHDPGLCNGIAAEIIIPQNSTSPILAVFLCLAKEGDAEPRGQDTHFKLGRILDGLEERLSERVPQ